MKKTPDRKNSGRIKMGTIFWNSLVMPPRTLTRSPRPRETLPRRNNARRNPGVVHLEMKARKARMPASSNPVAMVIIASVVRGLKLYPRALFFDSWIVQNLSPRLAGKRWSYAEKIKMVWFPRRRTLGSRYPLLRSFQKRSDQRKNKYKRQRL